MIHCYEGNGCYVLLKATNYSMVNKGNGPSMWSPLRGAQYQYLCPGNWTYSYQQREESCTCQVAHKLWSCLEPAYCADQLRQVISVENMIVYNLKAIIRCPVSIFPIVSRRVEQVVGCIFQHKGSTTSQKSLFLRVHGCWVFDLSTKTFHAVL